jgi:hypothetical protein
MGRLQLGQPLFRCRAVPIKISQELKNQKPPANQAAYAAATPERSPDLNKNNMLSNIYRRIAAQYYNRLCAIDFDWLVAA